jgi:ribosomal protein S18 acetylase RimI-like enzyme
VTKNAVVRIRRVLAADLPAVIALDRRVTGLAKSDYWHDIFGRYGQREAKEGFFLVATFDENDAEVVGFIIGEVRAWEFGSRPCGWVFALSVEPETRQHGVGEALFTAISAEFKNAGMSKMRTMVAKDSRLPLVFFRGEGMTAGPYIQLEKDID